MSLDAKLKEIITSFAPTVIMDQEDAVKCELVLSIIDKLEQSENTFISALDSLSTSPSEA